MTVFANSWWRAGTERGWRPAVGARPNGRGPRQVLILPGRSAASAWPSRRLFVRRSEANRVAVLVRDRHQEPDRTLAVRRGCARHRDFVAEVQRIRSVFETE